MPFKSSLVAAALIGALALTGCSSQSEPSSTAKPSESDTPKVAFIADGVYEFMFTEKTFADAQGVETLELSANGAIQFKAGQCAMDVSGADVSGNQIRILKPLGKNGWVFDSLSNSWTEMGSPWVSSLVSSYPSLIAFNRAAGEEYSFCALASLGAVSDVSAEDPALYVTNAEQDAWILANITRYAEGIAAAAGLEGDARAAAVKKIVESNTFGPLPENRIRIYDLAGLVTIEDATEASMFKFDLVRLDDSKASTFAPELPEDAIVTTLEMLAKSYIDNLG